MRGALSKALAIGLIFAFSSPNSTAEQVAGSFRIPVVGYVFDANLHAIRPVVGILGSSRIGAPIGLGAAVTEVGFLPDRIHAIVAAPEVAGAAVVNLEDPSRSVHIAGLASPIAMIRMSRDGGSAGLYPRAANTLVVVKGLPAAPAIHFTVDLSGVRYPLSRFAISNDGSVALLAFRAGDSDVLYSWTSTSGMHFVGQASRVSDMAFMGEDAVVADAGSKQVMLIRSVRNRATPVVLADVSDGITEPAAVFISSRNEIYVGNADTVLVINALGHLLRRVVCSCVVAGMEPLGSSAIRLTAGLDQPIYVLDETAVPERILFIPAVAEPAPEQ